LQVGQIAEGRNDTIKAMHLKYVENKLSEIIVKPQKQEKRILSDLSILFTRDKIH
jgi:hypothetical protein